MLSIFRTNQLFSSVLLLFYAALLRFVVFMAPFKWTPAGQGVMSNWVYDWLGWQGTGAQVVGLFLVMIQGFIVNYIVLENRLSNTPTLFPGVFYVLISSMFPDFLYLSPILLGNTFLLLALAEIMKIYRRPQCADKIFNAGFLTGLASLFFPGFLLMLIPMAAALWILRAPKMQELMLLLLGSITVLWLWGVGYYLVDHLPHFVQIQFVKPFGFAWKSVSALGQGAWIRIGIVALLILWVLLARSGYYAKKTIDAIKKINILYWVLFGGVSVVLTQGVFTIDMLLVFCPALGILIGFSFERLRPSVAEAIHLVVFIGIVVVHLSVWLV